MKDIFFNIESGHFKVWGYEDPIHNKKKKEYYLIT
jgi:hypothetical protein